MSGTVRNTSVELDELLRQHGRRLILKVYQNVNGLTLVYSLVPGASPKDQPTVAIQSVNMDETPLMLSPVTNKKLQKIAEVRNLRWLHTETRKCGTGRLSRRVKHFYRLDFVLYDAEISTTWSQLHGTNDYQLESGPLMKDPKARGTYVRVVNVNVQVEVGATGVKPQQIDVEVRDRSRDDAPTRTIEIPYRER